MGGPCTGQCANRYVIKYATARKWAVHVPISRRTGTYRPYRVALSLSEHICIYDLQQVYDKDRFSTDDRMGEAEIDIQPLLAAAKAYENTTVFEPMQLGKWLATNDDTLVKDSVISLVDGKVKQEITLRLQNVERGELEIELECVPLTQ
ncbi:hypothetical protein BHE74_00054787 [Ensete ventricosum]|nr:hypothetical protein BHE74_00054787 [Ensete ventricosum]